MRLFILLLMIAAIACSDVIDAEENSWEFDEPNDVPDADIVALAVTIVTINKTP